MLRLYSIAEWTAFLCSFLLFSKGIKRQYRIFFFYTLLVIVVEFWGRSLQASKTPNHILFTIVLFLFCTFYFYTLREVLHEKKKKQLVGWLYLLFFVFYFINLSFFQQFREFNSFSFIFGYTLLSICCSFYYLQFINVDKIVSIFDEPEFFAVTGYFIYSSLTAILYTIHKYFAYLNYPFDSYRETFQTINEVANVSLYLLLAFFFLMLWKKRKS